MSLAMIEPPKIVEKSVKNPVEQPKKEKEARENTPRKYILIFFNFMKNWNMMNSRNVVILKNFM